MKKRKNIFKPVPFGRVADYIEKAIKEKISSGKLEAGDKLPTEKELGSPKYIGFLKKWGWEKL